MPDHVVIARDSYIDIGPPFQYVDLFWLRAKSDGTRVEKVAITPAGDICTPPASVKYASALIPDSLPDLLDGVNPCDASSRKLKKRAQHCRNCLVFSGADVVIRAQCGDVNRVMPVSIFDRDMFGDPALRSEGVSWSMRLLHRLEDVTGPGPMEAPIFNLSAPSVPAKPGAEQTESERMRGLIAGEFDDLFPRSDQPASAIARQALNARALPSSVELAGATPMRPVRFSLPPYPPLARAAHVEGSVTATVTIDESGEVFSVRAIQGPKLLYAAVESAVKTWVFPEHGSGAALLTVAFTMSCLHQK